MNPNWLLSTHTDQDGAAIFQQARKMGLEGIVSKRLSAPYRSGPSRDWVKIPAHRGTGSRLRTRTAPAMVRHREERW
jgi:ATP-dependent DNA ligase